MCLWFRLKHHRPVPHMENTKIRMATNEHWNAVSTRTHKLIKLNTLANSYYYHLALAYFFTCHTSGFGSPRCCCFWRLIIDVLPRISVTIFPIVGLLKLQPNAKYNERRIAYMQKKTRKIPWNIKHNRGVSNSARTRQSPRYEYKQWRM